ncbi:MAG: ring-cleaving dioxygenase [Vicinamibacterales bacterium]
MELGGLHHVTAVTGDAPRNLDFYTRVLSLRLVKKTVNQDDVSAYHLFYADGEGNAGTDVTFFDWPNAGPNVPGTGTVAEIGLRVPSREALDWWQNRLAELDVEHGQIEDRGGRATLPFSDPEGQALAIVFDSRQGMTPGVPWPDSPVPVDQQILGLNHVVLAVGELMPTALVLTELLGFRESGRYERPDNPSREVVVFKTGPGGPGAEVHVEELPGQRRGRVGIGGVHHVAFRTPTDAEHRQWQQQIAGAGIGVTDVIDRFYFGSLYFREPGHVLYEIATDGPGFAVDEDAATLGEQLALPPFLEPRRAQIEAGLRPLDTTRVAR